MKKLERKEMKKCNGGFGPLKTLWRCDTGNDPNAPWYDNICYAGQPQVPCGYTLPCAPLGACTGFYYNGCVH